MLYEVITNILSIEANGIANFGLARQNNDKSISPDEVLYINFRYQA